MDTELVLLPQPRSITMLDGFVELREKGLIVLDSDQPQGIAFSGEITKNALWRQMGFEWDLSASCDVPESMIRLKMRIVINSKLNQEQYLLLINKEEIIIEANQPAGIYYGALTFIQIIQQSGKIIPCLRIEDWPDFSSRGVMLDISRDKVYRMETLYMLVDLFSSWKINQLQLYTEHTFAYQNHPVVWFNASPMTGEEILALDHYCKERFIQLVPNQNSFGHMERWLKHPEYNNMAETLGEYKTPWGTQTGPFSLAPVNPECLKFLDGLYAELFPHFSSSMVNVGCDETFDVGQGVSKVECEKYGKHQIYLDFLLKIYQNLKQRNKTMQFWGDIILENPESVNRLPKDGIALEWGYEGDHPFAEHGKIFQAAGVPFYVCPGTSAWNSIAGRTENCLLNLVNAAENGKKNGASGYLITDWGDNGHWQTLPISYLGISMGAAYSWCLDANRDVNVPQRVSRYAFSDPTGEMGLLAYELGNVHQSTGILINNSSVLFWALQPKLDKINNERLRPEAFRNCLKLIDETMKHLKNERMMRPDAAIIREEFIQTARLMRHACHRVLNAIGEKGAPSMSELADELEDIIDDYRSLWLKRNRSGGLDESINRFEDLIQEYRS